MKWKNATRAKTIQKTRVYMRLTACLHMIITHSAGIYIVQSQHRHWHWRPFYGFNGTRIQAKVFAMNIMLLYSFSIEQFYNSNFNLLHNRKIKSPIKNPNAQYPVDICKNKWNVITYNAEPVVARSLRHRTKTHSIHTASKYIYLLLCFCLILFMFCFISSGSLSPVTDNIKHI